MYRLRTFFTTLLIIAAVFLVGITTGCPAKTLDKAQSSSVKIATYANTGINITRDLFNSRVITLAQKNQIAQGWLALAQAGQAFDVTVVRLKQQYGSATPPASEIEALFTAFDDQVVNQFIHVLTALGVAGIPAEFQTVIAAIRTAVLIIAGMVGHKTQTAAKLAAAGA